MPLEDAKVNVHPEGIDPLKVRRRIVAARDADSPCYLIARDILKVWQMLLAKPCGASQYKILQSLLRDRLGKPFHLRLKLRLC